MNTVIENVKTFIPENVIIRENALDYPLGQKLHEKFKNKAEINTQVISSRGPFPFDYDISFKKKFQRAKKTLVIGVRSLNKFQSCKPSAHYQLPLVTGCPGHCQYCYLSTNLGKNPYIKIYVNIEQILNKANKYIKERKPEITLFEGAATSDPLPVEKWTGSLARCIKFFADNPCGKFRFVTKYTEVDSLLNIEHKGETEFRFSLNSDHAINKFESGTPGLEARIKAAKKVHQADYKTGFLIAPIFVYNNWKEEYETLIKNLQAALDNKGQDISFELITHRFTERAKDIIKKAYPNTELPMNEEARQFKYGQFGYGKYIYPRETMQEIEKFMNNKIKQYLPEAEIKYFV